MFYFFCPYSLLHRGVCTVVLAEAECPELVFINILWRAEILGFGCKTGYSAKPNQILIHKQHFTRILVRLFTTVKSC
jgi:hypothetical protein